MESIVKSKRSLACRTCHKIEQDCNGCSLSAPFGNGMTYGQMYQQYIGYNKSWQFLNLLNKFSSKMMFFSELGIRGFLENGFASFQPFLILQIWDKPEKLKIICCLSFRSHTIRAFSVLLVDSLRIISRTWRAGKNLKTNSDSAHQH
jgi:hypothetical protein